MRLLAFLSSIESSLRASGQLEGVEPCTRFVDYRRGTARMVVDDDSAVTLSLYRLASGRSCLRVHCEQGDRLVLIQTLYPDSEGFSWSSAAVESARALDPLLRREPVEVPAASVVNG